jgi:NAD(P)-dependent dehydrogenase (short-subunit alcohol dehydrogenase family)
MASALSNMVIWITGASSGIGRALALEAAAGGARLVLSGRHRESLAAVAKDCEARGARVASTLVFDLEESAARAEACARAPSLFGRIDVLVLNAGISQRSTFLGTSPEAFDRIMALDFSAQVDMVRRCLPAMVEHRSGCLVAVSSIAGLAGAPLRPAYSAAKHALAGLFQNLRADLQGSGVRVVTAFPGYVRTAVARNALDGDGKPLGVEDPNTEAGCDPARVARAILRSVLGGAVEPKLGFDAKTRLGLFLSRYMPSAWARLSYNHAMGGEAR